MSSRGVSASVKNARRLNDKTRASARRERVRESFPIRELPACVRNREPGKELSNSESLEVLYWFKDVLNDAATAAGLK